MKTLTTLGLALLITLMGTPARAQQNYTGVRVMIAADDANPNSVVRSSDMYNRIQIPLNEEMKRFGYTALFEDAVAAELIFKVSDRMSKQTSIQLAKAACLSGKATLCPRVLILVRTMATATDLTFGIVAKVRMTGEIIDANTNTYLGGWEAPTLDFPAGAGCNSLCIEDVVGDNARRVALNLADTLRRMLDQQALRGGSGRGAVAGRNAGRGLVNTFVINFEHFEMSEVLPFKSVIENEFPETLEVSMPQGASNSFTMNLSTHARADKVLDWLHLMVEDRGYNLKNIKVTITGDKFTVDRIVDDRYRPNGGRRFQ
jgi:hypothetical protein